MHGDTSLQSFKWVSFFRDQLVQFYDVSEMSVSFRYNLKHLWVVSNCLISFRHHLILLFDVVNEPVLLR